jgi:hypothetical protein
LLERAATTLTADEPVFFAFPTCPADGGGERVASVFGNPGYGVLHPATPESIRQGGEDGGEMGAYHLQRHCLQRGAVERKITRYLPIGIEAVLIPDGRMLAQPPGESAQDQ